MTSCGVWNTEMETKQNFIIWSALVAVPMLIGPILTVIMEFLLYLGKKCSKVQRYICKTLYNSSSCRIL